MKIQPIRYLFKKNHSELDPSFCIVKFSYEDHCQKRFENGKESLMIGMGESKNLNRRKLFLAIRKMIATAKTHKVRKIAIDADTIAIKPFQVTKKEWMEIFGTQAEMANWQYVEYKKEPEPGWDIVTDITFIGNMTKDEKNSLVAGQIIGEEVNHCRSLANTPAGDMTPEVLAQHAVDIAKGTDVKVSVLAEKDMEKLRMGAILGVAKGSSAKPRFIIMEYRRGGKEAPVVLIGKGVTFDSGGINLKPTQYIYEMHMDMSGGAAVIHTVMLASRLKLKKNVIGLIPAAENMVSGESYRPGDILRSMSGTTIEVLNTDAEGRLLLADALEYAKRYEPACVIDVATLTGASMVALGQRCSAVFTKSKNLEKNILKAAESSGDYAWPMPLWEEYEEELKGQFADIVNVSNSPFGGAITAAVFLAHFAKDFPWMHIDMAPRMTTISGEYLAKGAAGSPVRLLIHFLRG